MVERWQLSNHTADPALEVEAATPARLFAVAAIALLAQVADCERPVEAVSVEASAEGEDASELMLNWLNRVLLVADLEGAVWTRVEIERYDGRSVSARLHGPRRDDGSVVFRREVKAVPHRGMEVGLAPGRCRCRLVLDV